jgi:hypothetical protein
MIKQYVSCENNKKEIQDQVIRPVLFWGGGGGGAAGQDENLSLVLSCSTRQDRTAGPSYCVVNSGCDCL